MPRPILLVSVALGLTIASTFGGCSSSTTNVNGTNDGGGGADSSNAHQDGNASSSSGSSSGAGGDGASGDDGSTGMCPDNTPFTAATWTAPTVHPGACQTTDISAFMTACIATAATQATCNAWFNSNVATDAAAGTACGNCIFEPNNNGGTWSDQMGFFGPNYGACMQLVDPTHGAACAPAYANLQDCNGFECDSCADAATYQTCATTVDGTLCKQYATAAQTSCATDLADGGPGQVCFPSAGGATNEPDFQFIINLICGGGDGGSSSGGGDSGATDGATGG